MKYVRLIASAVSAFLLLSACAFDSPGEETTKEDTQPIPPVTDERKDDEDTTADPYLENELRYFPEGFLYDSDPAPTRYEMKPYIFAVSRVLTNMSYGNEKEIDPLYIHFSVPYYVYPYTTPNRYGVIDYHCSYVRFHSDAGIAVPYVEFAAVMEVPGDVILDEGFHSLTPMSQYEDFEKYDFKVTCGTTGKGLSYVAYESPDTTGGEFSATVYLRLSDDYVVRIDYRDSEEKRSYMQSFLDSVFITVRP